MTWSETLFNEIIVLFVLFAIFVIVYCKIKNQTLFDVLVDIREAFKK